jgi:hypothetical protein
MTAQKMPPSRNALGMQTGRIFLLTVLVAGGVGTIGTAPQISGSDAKSSDDPARPFFAKHCQTCHAGAKPKGDFRLDSLTSDFNDRANRERWLTVLEQVKTGAMPPKEKPRPAAPDVKTLADWIGGRAAKSGGETL